MFRKKQTVGQFIFDYLYKQGVTHAFGIPGDFALATFRWLNESKIKIITLTHEPSVGFAADCYARSKGLGVGVVTYCVGGLNTLNSIACAYAEKSPVLLISGGPSPEDRKKDPLVHHKVRTFDSQKTIYDEVTCASTILLDPKKAAKEIVRVVEEVKRQSRPGYIEIPFDVVDMVIDIPDDLFERENSESKSDPEILKECIKEITKKINKAKKPVIIAGVELHRFGLTDLASKLAKEHNIPIAATLLGKSVVRETNPLYIGVYSGALSEDKCRKYVEKSDCVILLGAFISDVLLGFNAEALNRNNTIVLNIDKTQVGLHSYSDILFKDILENMVNAPIKKREKFNNPNPVKFPKALESSKRNKPLDVESMFQILSSNLDEGSTIICDTGDALVGAIDLRSDMRQHFFSDAYYLSMGFATPATVGAMVAEPNSKTYTIVGDGAFQMTGMELSTIAKMGLDPVVIIINNDGYGTQRHIIDGPFNNIHMWDYTKICELLKYGKAVKVQTKGQMDDALKEAKNHDELYLIEAIVPKNSCSGNLKRMGEAIGKLRDKDK
ncbi:thiamine pyrophosphate-binding protein [Rickettsiales bacterium]|nr:thiamine pyrophosphate-binding protein [Rickettsiales bacterium]